ncbi:MAG: hypothetical protein DME26_18335, partial [Verrucomicrobia bacterium]
MNDDPKSIWQREILPARFSSLDTIRRLLRWRTLRRLLIGLAGFATLVALFYTEENWRGKRAWERHRREWEARGEKFTMTSMAPPPVPDEQNFALTPLLKPPLEYSLGSLEQGTLADLEACRNFYRGNTNYPQTAMTGTAAEEILVALSKFDTEMKELRDAAATRPYARFPIEYDFQPTFGILLPHLASMKSLCTVTSLRAIARLELGRSQEALEEIKLGFRLSDALREEPVLIDHLVRIATLAIHLQAVREGLVRHA